MEVIVVGSCDEEKGGRDTKVFSTDNKVQAEEYFKEVAKALGCTDEDMDAALEDGYHERMNGLEYVEINWFLVDEIAVP